MILPALPVLAGKAAYLVKFLLYRMAVWSGAVALWRRGSRTGKRRYWAAAVLVYAASWAAVLLLSAGFWVRLKALRGG